jgi:AbrB family looped-hinge helix DNA binding protein
MEEDTVTIDAAGRIVIPASIRRELALTGGTELSLTIDGGSLHLRPVARAPVEERGGRLVITSPLAGPVPDHRELREERADALGGRKA